MFRSCLGIGLLLSLVVTEAYSQILIPASIKTESGIDITPLVQIKLSHDNNIASTNLEEVSSWIFELTPSVLFSYMANANRYQLTLAANQGRHFSSSKDNYTDLYADFQSELELNQVHRFSIVSTYVAGHQKRGTGVAEGLGHRLDGPLEYESVLLKTYYEYGALSTRARLRFNAGYSDKRFNNYTELTQTRNFDAISYGSIFFYDSHASTSLVMEIAQEHLRFDVLDPSGNRDSNSIKYRVGVDWEASALTRGVLRVGLQNKTFLTSDRQAFRGLTWDFTLSYQPLTYSTFRFTTGREAKEPNIVGDYVKETNFGLNWKHEWSKRFGSNVDYRYSRELFSGINRKDNENALSLEGGYTVLPNIFLAAGIVITDKDSTMPTMRFDKTVSYLTLRLGL